MEAHPGAKKNSKHYEQNVCFWQNIGLERGGVGGGDGRAMEGGPGEEGWGWIGACTEARQSQGKEKKGRAGVVKGKGAKQGSKRVTECHSRRWDTGPNNGTEGPEDHKPHRCSTEGHCDSYQRRRAASRNCLIPIGHMRHCATGHL